MLKNRSRYTIPQLLLDIDLCKYEFIHIKNKEEQAQDYFYESLYDSKNDDWYLKHKAIYRLKDDHIYYQQLISKRLKVEKKLRLLQNRLDKLYNIHKISHVEKIMLINHLSNFLDCDCILSIKNIMKLYFCPNYFIY